MYSVDITVEVGKNIELDVTIAFNCTFRGAAPTPFDPPEMPEFEVDNVTPLTFYGSTLARSCEEKCLRDWYPIVKKAAEDAVDSLEDQDLLYDHLLEEYCVSLRE